MLKFPFGIQHYHHSRKSSVHLLYMCLHTRMCACVRLCVCLKSFSISIVQYHSVFGQMHECIYTTTNSKCISLPEIS